MIYDRAGTMYQHNENLTVAAEVEALFTVTKELF
jgi:hypothetical protein